MNEFSINGTLTAPMTESVDVMLAFIDFVESMGWTAQLSIKNLTIEKSN